MHTVDQVPPSHHTTPAQHLTSPLPPAQVLLFTAGKAKATVTGKDQAVSAGDVVVVPAGTQHQFVNTGDVPLELITIYAPGEHDPKTVHKTKEEGDELEDAGKDEAPEWSQQSKKHNEEAGLVKESGGPY